jgi:23S rRNA (adenine2503-C2)-methyltransferase
LRFLVSAANRYFNHIFNKETGFPMTINICSMTLHDLTVELQQRFGKGVFHATALYKEYFRNGNVSFENIPEFSGSPRLLPAIASHISLPVFTITKTQEQDVVKFATTFPDGCTIESVVIPSAGKKRTTLCVSSQAGCRMNCAFCATGSRGFLRSLSAEEIVVQVWAARFTLGHHIDNIVFMGMGEPLDNIRNVVQAIRVMSDPHGLNIPQRSITLSTAGLADRIRDLALYGIPHVKLALSLNAPTDELRDALMPVNRTFPLHAIKKCLADFPLGKGGVFFIEYVLLSGVNDSREMAHGLADFLQGLPVRINLIPFNENPSSSFKPPDRENVRQFAAWLVERKLFVRIRKSYGAGISAACGQLSVPNTLPATFPCVSSGFDHV